MRYLVLIGLIVGGLLGYYVLWSHLADQVALRANAWIEGQRRQGRTVTYENQRLWGFPYRLSMTLTKASWADTPNPLGWHLEAEEITAHLQLWDLHHAIFDLPGRLTIGWRADGGDRQMTLTSQRFRASLVADGAGNWLRAAADLTKPQLSDAPAGAAATIWSAEKLLLHSRRTGNVPPSADLAVQLDGIMLPVAIDSPLGHQVQGLRLVGNARGSLFGRTPEEMLTSWRESGGVVDLSIMTLTWGEFYIDGSGSLALDRQFRPIGAMSGKLGGIETAADILVAAGTMSLQQGAAAKSLMAPQPVLRTEKGMAYQEGSLTAQDGMLSLGPVPLFSLPSVLPGH
ncbi:MAG: DUF2125 domain-containing protein [Ferrovibrio sp.]|uniref:DUF2125 domain-containing protein n=1 Tax=Ferrovibrio sp. TaxID=1917215 RepID=UPI00262121AB|nr:DUF2125 domain-containing protein [Ferrovibrio sp.]MCW0236043.1 DUF2125 domain-containing protein [Ferrovibrio sp.]